MKPRLPEVTLYRLAFYVRVLERLSREGRELVRSEELARLCGVSPAQLRKDLSYLGGFGVRGVGYQVKSLERQLKRILGRDRLWHLALAGINDLGLALLSDRRLSRMGLRFVAAFDWREEWIGRIVQEVYVYSVDQMSYIVRESEVEIGVLTVEEPPAREMARRLSEAGVRAILNLGPEPLEAPEEGIILRNADLTLPFDLLTYALS
ncbi:redox-sensing transcriptional repressor Rex [Thermosulfurimonas marina]|uniref:redox-sensing transcriptional repressor Rex n=1 Tax=Thermosulfurimonas marina TaxID=2047767 RepID=UPI00144A839B|nr:redox-sensing transcriptional repressor Rex [Thermosulfurimonas marina]